MNVKDVLLVIHDASMIGSFAFVFSLCVLMSLFSI